MSASTRRTPSPPSRSRAPRLPGWALTVLPFTLVALLLVGGAVWIVRGQAAEQSEPIAGQTSYDDLGRDHVQDPIPSSPTPPAGGDHAPAWVNCGVYDELVPSELAVHSLEHGAVWLSYSPDLSADDVAILADEGERDDYVLISPMEDQASPVVATAWGEQLELDSADDPRLSRFLSRYVQGPQTPEPGAPCSGGVQP